MHPLARHLSTTRAFRDMERAFGAAADARGRLPRYNGPRGAVTVRYFAARRAFFTGLAQASTVAGLPIQVVVASDAAVLLAKGGGVGPLVFDLRSDEPPNIILGLLSFYLSCLEEADPLLRLQLQEGRVAAVRHHRDGDQVRSEVWFGAGKAGPRHRAGTD